LTVRNSTPEWLLNRRFASAEQSAQDAATATVDDVDRAHTTRANGEAHGLAALNLKDETILALLVLAMVATLEAGIATSEAVPHPLMRPCRRKGQRGPSC